MLEPSWKRCVSLTFQGWTNLEGFFWPFNVVPVSSQMLVRKSWKGILPVAVGMSGKPLLVAFKNQVNKDE